MAYLLGNPVMSVKINKNPMQGISLIHQPPFVRMNQG